MIYSELAWTLSVAAALGFAVGLSYAWFYRGYFYSHTFVYTCILTVVLCALIVHVVAHMKPEIATAIGFAIAGMLGLIRFRTVVRDSREFGYLFLSIVIGVAVGAEQALLAAIGCLLSLLVLAGLEVTRLGQPRVASVRIKVEAGRDTSDEASKALDKCCKRFKLVEMRHKDKEREKDHGIIAWWYDAVLRSHLEIPQVVQSLRGVPGVTFVSITMWTRSRATAETED